MNEMDAPRKKANLRTLRVLLVISFVVSGYHLLAYLMTAAMLPMMREVMPEMASKFPDEFAIVLDKFMVIPQWYFLVAGLLNVASVTGLALMWKLRGSGFHCYTLSKLLLMLMPVLFLDRSYIALGDIMMAILFIVYYFILFRMLGVFGSKSGVNAEESAEKTDSESEGEDSGAENE